MQIIYGNDGVNYKLFAQSEDVTKAAFTGIHNEFHKYNFVKNSDLYSQKNEIRNVIYSSTNLKGRLQGDYAVVANNGHMPQFHTPSKFFQAYALEADRDFYRKGFFSIFKIKWIEADRLLEYMDQPVVSLPDCEQSFDAGSSLSKEDMRNILILIYKNSLSVSKKQLIAADESGDTYNERALQILWQIYEYLPYDMRRSHGFSTYVSDNWRDSEITTDVRILMTDPALVSNKKNIYLIGQDNSLLMRGQTEGDVADFVDFLMSLTTEVRKNFFDLAENTYSEKRLTIKECLYLYRLNIELFSQPAETALPVWLEQYFNAENEGLKTYIGQEIEHRTSSEIYAGYFSEAFQKEKDPRYFSDSFIHLLAGCDISEKFAGDSEELFGLYIKQIEDMLIGTKNQTENVEILEKYIADLKQQEIYGKAFESVLNHVIDVCETYLINAREQEAKETEEEKQDIQNDLQKVWNQREVTSGLLESFLKKWYRHLRYPKQNTEVILNCWRQVYHNILKQFGAYFAGKDEKKYMESLLRSAENYLDPKEYEAEAANIQKMSAYLEQFEKLRIISFERKEDIQKFMDEEMSREKVIHMLKKKPSVPMLLDMGDKRFKIPYQKLQLFMKFCHTPKKDSKEEEVTVELLQSCEGLLERMLDYGFLKEEHFYAACRGAEVYREPYENGNLLIDEVLDYFLRDKTFHISVDEISAVAENTENPDFYEEISDFKWRNKSVRRFLKQRK